VIFFGTSPWFADAFLASRFLIFTIFDQYFGFAGDFDVFAPAKQTLAWRRCDGNRIDTLRKKKFIA
jgi:hypothetical protein